ncbi:MAG: WD40 repeat domain-containing protein, partial [Okeania sp. SIO3C4]|nr:WD40 repeat domain-containing protein [Okeania sp. SIO3C4]
MGKFAEKLASATPARKRAMLGNIHTLVESQQLEKYYKLLTNFDFLAAKVQHPDFGVQELIEDYDLIEDNNEKVRTLKLIQGALRLSAHILEKEGDQLPEQLWGRMQDFAEPEIQELLLQALVNKQGTWLVPLKTSLTPPGGLLICTLAGHGDWVNVVAVTPDGKQVISGSFDDTIKVWKIETGKEINTLKVDSGLVNAVAVTRDGNQVISVLGDKTIQVWSIKTGEINTLKVDNGLVNAIAVTPDGNQVVFGLDDNTIKVWSIEVEEVTHTLRSHSDQVSTLAVTPDGKQVIFGSFDDTIKVWSIETGQEIRTLTGHSNLVRAVAVTPDGKQVISGSDDNTIKV